MTLKPTLFGIKVGWKRHKWIWRSIIMIIGQIIFISSHICITDREDEMVWKHAAHEAYTPKLGYIHLNLDIHLWDPCQWWKGLGKLNAQ